MIADNTFLKSNFQFRNSIAICPFIALLLYLFNFVVPQMPAGILVYESVSVENYLPETEIHFIFIVGE
jgi:hypothetical protein